MPSAITYVPGLTKGFTVSPPPSASTYNAMYYSNFIDKIHKVLKPFCTYYWIYPELDTNERWHCHGVFEIKQQQLIKYKMTINRLSKIGFYKIEHFNRNNGKSEAEQFSQWLKYIEKDAKAMEVLLSYHNIRCIVDSWLTIPFDSDNFRAMKKWQRDYTETIRSQPAWVPLRASSDVDRSQTAWEPLLAI